MPYLAEMMNTDDAPFRRLYYFVLDSEEVLEQVVQARHILFSITFRQLILEAHQSYNERSRGRIHGTLQGGDFDRERLVVAGLEGPQLNAKLGGYSQARIGLIERGGRKALGRALRWMNSILSSLSAAFPPAEALRELKELVENGAKDVEELEASR